MNRKIKVYGPLAKFLGWKEIEANCNSVAEAVQFLVSNWPDVEGHMAKQHYKVEVNQTPIDESELQHVSGGDIKITPVVAGARGTLKTILGIALIVGSFFIPGGTGTLAVFGKSLTYSKIAMTIGVTLAAQGLSEMLAPPMPEADNDPTRAFSFNGIQQSSRAGVAIPILFGEVYTGSVVINQDLDTTGPHEIAVANGGV